MMASDERPDVCYDRGGDVLYISLGPPRPNFVREDPEVEGLYYCYTFGEEALCGVTVVWYSTQNKDTLRRKIPFAVELP